MRPFFFLLFAVTALTSSLHSQAPTAALPDPPLIPRPVRAIIQPGSFSIDDRTVIVIDTGQSAPIAAAAALADMIGRVSPFRPEVKRLPAAEAAPGSIVFAPMISDMEVSHESYAVRVFPAGIRISSTHEAGAHYGVQTLRQLLPARFESSEGRDTVTSWTLPSAMILDKPRFPWRGLLLDCSRHFMDVDFVKRVIDHLAMLKMNRLHWHLTDDQGWRIEISKHPALTSVGGWRRQSDGSIYGGYYTQEQIRELVRYGAERHVTLVPEIEMPGHALAALAAYPRYSCTGGPFEVAATWGVFEDVFCPGKDETLTFLEDVLAEVLDLFPSPYIHIGGDEVPKHRWKQCRDCQTRIRQEGLADEEELQAWFTARIAAFLRERGRIPVGWDEILEGGLPESAVVQSWRGMQGATAAVAAGHDAIVSPASHSYFDYDITTTDLQKVYSFNPVPDTLKAHEAERILGGECAMWTEHAPQRLVEARLFPRIFAMAELLWTPKELRDYRHFHNRVQQFYARLDSLGVDYGYETTPVRFNAVVDTSQMALRVSLTAGQPGLTLQYAHSETAADFTPFTEALYLRGSGVLAARAQGPGTRVSGIHGLHYDVHTALGAEVRLDRPPHERYTADGAATLTDGVRGSTTFHHGRWLGFSEEYIEALVDLGKPGPVREIRAGFLQHQQAWIFLPKSVKFDVSADGQDFQHVGRQDFETQESEEAAFTAEAAIQCDIESARYIRVRVHAIGICPDWHAGAGNAAWLFMDEIIVR